MCPADTGIEKHTQQWRNTFRDCVGHTETQQQHTDDWGSQPSHNKMEVNVSDTVSIHLQEGRREGDRDGFFVPVRIINMTFLHISY